MTIINIAQTDFLIAIVIRKKSICNLDIEIPNKVANHENEGNITYEDALQ